MHWSTPAASYAGYGGPMGMPIYNPLFAAYGHSYQQPAYMQPPAGLMPSDSSQNEVEAVNAFLDAPLEMYSPLATPAAFASGYSSVPYGSDAGATTYQGGADSYAGVQQDWPPSYGYSYGSSFGSSYSPAAFGAQAGGGGYAQPLSEQQQQQQSYAHHQHYSGQQQQRGSRQPRQSYEPPLSGRDQARQHHHGGQQRQAHEASLRGAARSTLPPGIGLQSYQDPEEEVGGSRYVPPHRR